MLRRKMYAQLLEWRKTKKKECLLIKGARQIGKTYLVEAFGRAEYQHFVEINFLRDAHLREIFAGDLSADVLFKGMTAYIPGIQLQPGKTLIFLDEIQKCARARTALKFLAEDDRFDVIASGSLLGLHYGRDDDREVEEVESVPVGYERQITMYSLDFEEFLWARGYSEDAISYMREYFDRLQPLPSGLHEKYTDLLREYLVVGGMPEAVVAFVEQNDFTVVQLVQEKILATYDDDIANHAKGAEKVKVRACYDSIPRQLARENKKFKYSEVEKKSTARKYADSIVWLQDSALVHICRNVYEPYLPLLANAKETEFKLYVNDTGLLMAMYGMQTKLAVLTGKARGNAKGGIYENLVSEMLVKRGYNLYYYKLEDSTLEIEFVIEKDGEVQPIEVKAGNAATPSLNHFLLKYEPSKAYKLIDGNIGVVENKISLPHYMAIFL